MRSVSLTKYSDSHQGAFNHFENCICIINDHQYDDKLVKEIIQSTTNASCKDILLFTKGKHNTFHYLKPFFYITYHEESDQFYQENLLQNPHMRLNQKDQPEFSNF